jgi:hypothetical protein
MRNPFLPPNEHASDCQHDDEEPEHANKNAVRKAKQIRHMELDQPRRDRISGSMPCRQEVPCSQDRKNSPKVRNFIRRRIEGRQLP